MPKKSRKSTKDQSHDSADVVPTTLSTLRQDADLWYRLLILLHDLNNIGSDPLAEKRLSSTTHELYISAPYFSESEATKIRATMIDSTVDVLETEDESASSTEAPSTSSPEMLLEEAIHNRLASFFDKRKASGDSRPCGPHDMLPVYISVFGIRKEELQDERFLSRLRRSGVGEIKPQQGSAASGEGGSRVKGQKRAGKGK